MSEEFKAGDIVCLARMPAWVDELKEESGRVFRHCIGKNYRITEIDQHGHFVLDVSKDVDALFGGYMNDIRLEAEYLEKVTEK